MIELYVKIVILRRKRSLFLKDEKSKKIKESVHLKQFVSLERSVLMELVNI